MASMMYQYGWQLQFICGYFTNPSVKFLYFSQEVIDTYFLNCMKPCFYISNVFLSTTFTSLPPWQQLLLFVPQGLHILKMFNSTVKCLVMISLKFCCLIWHIKFNWCLKCSHVSVESHRLTLWSTRCSYSSVILA